jgi:1-deoxy-D-xylulose-5-phosphate reductoisomerase
MRLPIQCALSYPERVAGNGPQRLNLARTKSLNFGEPDLGRYPCLRLALEAGARGGTWPAALAAADEVAVECFMAGRISFTDIAKVVDSTLSAHAGTADPVLEAVLEADRWAREYASTQAASMAPLARAR